jgi:hypothetical protein
MRHVLAGQCVILASNLSNKAGRRRREGFLCPALLIDQEPDSTILRDMQDHFLQRSRRSFHVQGEVSAHLLTVLPYQPWAQSRPIATISGQGSDGRSPASVIISGHSRSSMNWPKLRTVTRSVGGIRSQSNCSYPVCRSTKLALCSVINQ